MNRILDLSRPLIEGRCAGTIPVGQAFKGRPLSSGQDGLFLRIYDGFVNLGDPMDTWTPAHSFVIYDYRPVDLEITARDLEK